MATRTLGQRLAIATLRPKRVSSAREECCSQCLQALFNLCKLSRTRQEQARDGTLGAAPRRAAGDACGGARSRARTSATLRRLGARRFLLGRSFRSMRRVSERWPRRGCARRGRARAEAPRGDASPSEGARHATNFPFLLRTGSHSRKTHHFRTVPLFRMAPRSKTSAPQNLVFFTISHLKGDICWNQVQLKCRAFCQSGGGTRWKR